MTEKAPLADCDTCPLKDEPHVLGMGPEHPRIVVVGEAPGRDEVRSGIPFIGRSGQLLNKILAHHNIDRDEVYLTNTVLCRPPNNRTPTANEIRHCKARLIAEIEGLKPQAILAMGSPAAKTLLNAKKGITILRVGGAKKAPGLSAPVIPTFHPAAALRAPDVFPTIVADVGKLTKPIHVGWEPTRYEVIATPNNATWALQGLMAKPIISLDIETAPPFDKHNPNMLCIGMSGQEGHAYVFAKNVVDNYLFKDALNKLFLTNRFVMQNGKFDIQHLWSLGITNARVDEDTMLQSYMLDERKGVHGLEQLATEFLGAPQYKQDAFIGQEESANLADLPPAVLHQYNATDVDVTLRLTSILKKEMESDDVTKPYYELLIPGSATLAAMEYRGFQVDETKLDEFEEQLDERSKAKAIELERWVANPRSPHQLKRAFAELMHSDELATTNKQMLTFLIEKDPTGEVANFARAVLDYRRDHKSLTTYVRGIRKRLKGGRIYTTFKLHGTETGRLSSANPNMQNVTQGELRSMFTASSPEHTLLTADYSGIELRVAALELDSPWLLDALRDSKRDIHQEVALELFGPDYTELQYRGGKAVTFGIFFDRQAPAIAAQLRIPVRQAQKMIDHWKERCPELETYFERTRNAINERAYLRSRFGRLRRFWFITAENRLDVYREGYNFRIQSPAGDITLRSLNRFHSDGLLDPVVTVHDSITFDVHTDLEDAKNYARKVMEDVPDFDVPMPIKIKDGYRWS